MNVSFLKVLRFDLGKQSEPFLWAVAVDRGWEVSVRAVSGLEEAARLVSEEVFDLVLCPSRTADFTACAVLEMLNENCRGLPLMVLAESWDDSCAIEALRRGAVEVLQDRDRDRFAAWVEREAQVIRARQFKLAEATQVKQLRPKTADHGPVVTRESLLQIASDAAQMGGWMLELPNKKVTWSDQVCEIYGVAPGTSPLLEEALRFVAEEWRAIVVEVFEKCINEGSRFDEEIQIITKQQDRIWLRIVGEAIKGNDCETLRLQGAIQDITEIKSVQFNQDELRRETEQIYQKQRSALIELTQCIPLDSHDAISSFHRITERAAATLGVARVSIWKYMDDRSALICLDLFQAQTGEHSEGMILIAKDYPAYFRGLTEAGIISADDAHSSPYTFEFSENYLTPLGITSMLDVPVHGSDGIEYFMCNEHIGPARCWTAPEKTFAIAIANLVSLVIQSAERSRVQTQLIESLQRFQSVANATSDTIWDWDLDSDAVWWGAGFNDLFGIPADPHHLSIKGWIELIHPEDRASLVNGIYAVIRGTGHRWSAEYRSLHPSGKITHILGRGTVIRDTSGKGIRMVGGMMDLTARKLAELELTRTHRALQMLTSCGEMLIRAVDENELLAETCRLAVEVGGYRMAWIGYAMNDSAKRVKPMAQAGEEHGYLSESIISWDPESPGGMGPVGCCIREGRAIYLEDIIGKFNTLEYLEPALKRGYRSVICLPFRDEKSVFGVLCLYSDQACQTGTEEIQLLLDMAGDLAFGIQNIRTRKMALRMHDVVTKVAQAVSTGIDSTFFDLLTSNMVEACGALGGLIGRYDPIGQNIETISLVLGGQLAAPVTYPIAGTPCEAVVSGLTCVFPESLRERFPKSELVADLEMESYIGLPLLDQRNEVVGLMTVFFSKPLEEAQFVQSTLQIFAVRAAAELARQQADARIREQASLLDLAQDAISVRDLDHKITFWNKSAERLFGWTSEEAVGRRADDILFHNPDAYHLAHQQTLLDGEWVGEINQKDKYGRRLIIKVRWSLVRNSQGVPVSILAIDTDISEYRKLENQFLRAQRLESIGTLAGGIAHDLNNILSPIFMAAELLKMRDQDARSSELLATIENSARRGAEMVGQVLSFARGQEAGKIQIHPRQLINEIEIIARDTFLKKGYFKVRAKRDLWTLQGDPTQLQQILLNLCVNAHDAIQDGGDISISAENCYIDAAFAALNLHAHVGPYVCLEVADTGIGIPAHIIEKIFDPFFTTKTGNKGTGLGLSTSLTIVKSHGGFIEATSTPSEGTRFRVYLPAQEESISPILNPSDSRLPRGNGELILVVDDESAIREMATQTLQTYGYRTIVAENGEVAIAQYIAHREEICLVFTDIMMPILDGIGVIQQLTELNPHLKIIATSGVVANREPAEQAGRAGATILDFLPKPYTPQTLLVSLQHALLQPAESAK
jgi:PAS domain S-box-containing protein